MFAPLRPANARASRNTATVIDDLQPITPEKPQIPVFTLDTYCTPSLDNIGEVYCEADAFGAPDNASLVYTWIWDGIKQTETGKVLHMTGIPEGDYEIQVQAIDPKSGFSANMTSMRLQVQTVIQNDPVFELPQTVRGWMDLVVMPVSIFLFFALVAVSIFILRRRKRTGQE